MHKKTIPTVVLGGSGYVAAEVLRLLIDHPYFRIQSVVSSSNHGTRIDAVFPHLTGPIEDLTFEEFNAAVPLLQGRRQVAVFSAMPHGETAPVFKELFSGETAARVVDMSADFRFKTPENYRRIYGKDHPAPELLDQFECQLPDLTPEIKGEFIAHPGCFTTGVTLGLAPLVQAGLIEPEAQVSSVTGSTGAGRQPGAGTHHPHRQSSMWAYQPLVHRHQPEIERLAGIEGTGFKLAFVPHSGPFSRGIHSTLFATLAPGKNADDVAAAFAAAYGTSPFIKVAPSMPTLKEVVGSNRCHIGYAVNGSQLVVTTVIDNLVKGAAGGAVQWMNRMFELDETEGLNSAVHGWI